MLIPFLFLGRTGASGQRGPARGPPGSTGARGPKGPAGGPPGAIGTPRIECV